MPVTVDPWLEADNFGPPLVDFAMRPEDAPEDDINLDQYPVLSPEIVQDTRPAGDPSHAPVVTVEVDETPEVVQLPDGGQVTLEKEKGQWKATLDPGNGANPEVFWGKNKNQLVTNVLSAKLNATKKIRELNMKVKLGGQATPQSTPAAQPLSKTLTADEVFEIKTSLESNPDLALENWFQKKTGLSVAQLVSLAQKGAAADASLGAETVAKDFIARNPEYYADPGSKNVGRIISWLGKFKLGKANTDVGELYTHGFWTVDAIEEAFNDLSEEGFLVKAPKPTSPVAPAAEPVTQPRTDERIVRTETRPRAGLGLRPNDVSPTPPVEAQKPPSVEDLDALSDVEIANTLAAIRRSKALSRRSQ